MPAMNAIIIESLPEDQRGSGLGVYKLVTWFPRMVTEFLGGVLLDRLGLLPGFKVILAWSTIASILILVIRTKGLKETLVPNPKARTQGFKFLLSNLPRSIIALILVGGVSSFAHRMTMPFLVVYAVEVVGLSKTQWGFISMVTGIIAVILGTWGGILSDKIGRKPCLLFSRVVEPFSKLGFVAAKGFRQVFSVQAFYSLGSAIGGNLIMKGLMMGGPAWQAYVADIVPSSDRGRIMGLMGSAQILLGLPSSWFGGYLWEHYSPELTFQVSGVIGFLAPIILYLFV
jgi:MFS family permease